MWVMHSLRGEGGIWLPSQQQATVYTYLLINLKMLHFAPLLPPTPEGTPCPPLFKAGRIHCEQRKLGQAEASVH